MGDRFRTGYSRRPCAHRAFPDDVPGGVPGFAGNVEPQGARHRRGRELGFAAHVYRAIRHATWRRGSPGDVDLPAAPGTTGTAATEVALAIVVSLVAVRSGVEISIEFIAPAGIE